jgi:hypothetical protein
MDWLKRFGAMKSARKEGVAKNIPEITFKSNKISLFSSVFSFPSQSSWRNRVLNEQCGTLVLERLGVCEDSGKTKSIL